MTRPSSRLALCLAVVSILALPAAAPPFAPGSSARDRIAPADITGHWEADVAGDGKTFTFMFDFVAKAETFTGTVGLSNQDRTFPISDGKIKGNKVSFRGFGIWTGDIVGDELKLTRELDYGRKQNMVAHRTKG